MPFPHDGSSVISQAQRDLAWLALVEEIRTRLMSAESTSQRGLASPAKGKQKTWVVPYRRNPFFTGRETLLETVRERLQTARFAGSTRVLALGGLGDIGKTQVALEYAHRYRHDYSAVLWFTTETPEALLAEVLRLAEHVTLLTDGEQGADAAINLLKDWHHRHQGWLPIFENDESIESVNPYLPAESNRNGQIVLTTRAMTAGGLAEMIPIEEMSRSGGALLLHRAGFLTADASLEQASEQMRTSAERLVAEMDGLALAIDQVGAYIGETGCSLERYLYLFRQCRTRLLALRGISPAGHPESVVTTWKLVLQKSSALLPPISYASAHFSPQKPFLKHCCCKRQCLPVPGQGVWLLIPWRLMLLWLHCAGTPSSSATLTTAL